MARILAALSGGVDSSVAAALLVAQGHEVVAVSLQLSDESRGGAVSRCCSAADIHDARRVAGHLGIPHYVLNEEDLFDREVVTPFANGYRAGRTPNPCVACNSRLKFGSLLSIARSIGADRVATGHYARLVPDPATGRGRILRGRDREKDQSYFLFDLDEAQRDAALFPMGERTKAEAYRLAESFELPVAGKPESQDLCFIPGGDVAGWLADRLGPAREGDIRHVDGRLLGRHGGIREVTIGQRRGLGVSGRRPLHVVAVEAATDTVVVGEREHLLSCGLVARGVRLHDARLQEGAFRAEARIRHRHPGAAAEVKPGGDGQWEVRFDEPQWAVTPGQAVVFYDGDLLLGGGWIDGPLVESSRPAPVECGVSRGERA
ncbi:MAG TPA: tRNA 2-thiouridine(34) synthase MnmA [Candidatus Saccharimonadales bacterium]|nr:tRNA 2-thiouridine(34) synthase MnmA [Candidatus Saccharimonadales bacterium]